MQELHQVVTARNLRTTWSELRKEMRRVRFRDVVDWLEYDANPEVWIRRLVDTLKSGSYEPRSPRRLRLAKSNGFSRTITVPSIEDAVLLRLLVNYLFDKVEHRQCKHVYFDQAQHASLRRHIEQKVGAPPRYLGGPCWVLLLARELIPSMATLRSVPQVPHLRRRVPVYRNDRCLQFFRHHLARSTTACSARDICTKPTCRAALSVP